MLSVLPYSSRPEPTERPFKAYNPPPTPRSAPPAPRPAMSTFYPPPQPQTNNYYPSSYPAPGMTSCMTSLRPEMTSSMYQDHNQVQQPAFPGTNPQWGDYSINNMLNKKPDYTPSNSLLAPLLEQKPYQKPSPNADSTTKPDVQVGNSTISSQNTDTTTSPTPSSDSKTSSSDDDNKPPKKRAHTVADDMKDNSYFDRRRKNNESARRSRDNRRVKEEQIAMRVIYLEQENLQLRTEVSLLKADVDKLRCMLYNS